MSIFKKFVAPLTAVALVAVMGVSLLTAPRTAEAANIVDATVAGGTISTTNNQVWAATAIPTKGLLSANIVITEVTAWTLAGADTVTITHTGYKLANITATYTATLAGTWAYNNGNSVFTVTATGNAGGANDTITITAVDVAVGANTTDGTVVAATTNGVSTIAIASQTAKRMMLGNSTTTTAPAVIDTRVPTYSADPAAAGGALCAYVADSAGAAATGIPVTFTVSLGVVSTGTSKSAIALTAAAGTACTNYRGGGGVAATDTAIASNSSINQVATLSITLTAPAGNTASKLIITAPSNGSVAANITNVSPGYVSPMVQTNFAVQVQDSAGLGVANQVVLITVDKGYLAVGFNAAACGTAKAQTQTSTVAPGQALTSGGTAVVGGISMTYCANPLDAPGQATITASNITTSMANATTTISTAGRPAKVEATFANGVITATVKDANGNNVANGTQVQFTISQNAGAVSNACTTTTNGQAQSAVSLNSGSGTVIVTASWNETGALAAGCAAVAAVAQGGNAGAIGSVGTSLNGAQSTSATVAIGTVVTPPPTTTPPPAVTGSGTFASAPVYSAGKLAQVVYNGGTVAQLEAAVVAANGTGVWAQTSTGVFVLYIVNGGFVNDAFKAAFPNGFAGVTAVTVVGK